MDTETKEEQGGAQQAPPDGGTEVQVNVDPDAAQQDVQSGDAAGTPGTPEGAPEGGGDPDRGAADTPVERAEQSD